MKDECAGRPTAEYVGLRPKMYSILEAGGGNIKKAKGVKKNVAKRRIRHEQYKEALFEKRTFRHNMDVLRSERHRIYGQHHRKVSLSPFDSKRWIAKMGKIHWPMVIEAPARHDPEEAAHDSYSSDRSKLGIG